MGTPWNKDIPALATGFTEYTSLAFTNHLHDRPGHGTTTYEEVKRDQGLHKTAVTLRTTKVRGLGVLKNNNYWMLVRFPKDTINAGRAPCRSSRDFLFGRFSR